MFWHVLVSRGGNYLGWTLLWSHSCGHSPKSGCQSSHASSLKCCGQNLPLSKTTETRLIFSGGSASEIWKRFQDRSLKIHGYLCLFLRSAMLQLGESRPAFVQLFEIDWYNELNCLKATAKHPRAKRHESITANEPDRDVFPSLPTLSSILLSLDPIELLPLSLARSEGEEHSQRNTDSRGFTEAFLDYILPEQWSD